MSCSPKVLLQVSYPLVYIRPALLTSEQVISFSTNSLAYFHINLYSEGSDSCIILLYLVQQVYGKFGVPRFLLVFPSGITTIRLKA